MHFVTVLNSSGNKREKKKKERKKTSRNLIPKMALISDTKF